MVAYTNTEAQRKKRKQELIARAERALGLQRRLGAFEDQNGSIRTGGEASRQLLHAVGTDIQPYARSAGGEGADVRDRCKSDEDTDASEDSELVRMTLLPVSVLRLPSLSQ